MSKTANFALVTAFTTNVYAGNPAAIVFLDPHLPPDALGKIAGNFNQPITSIVSPTSDTSDNDKTITRHIRYMVSNKEIPICGHGTLAAAKILFTQLGPGQENVDTIHFRCVSGASLVAIKRDNGFIEIELPSGVLVKVSSEEETRLTSVVNKAFGREVLINSIRRGGPGVYHYYLIVEIDEKENLGASIIDPNALVDTGYFVNVLTSSATNTDDLFVSRMFAPTTLLEGEDSACGTAHCLLTPYWCEKYGIAPGQEVSAKQVSKRGGSIWAIWDDVRGTVKLRGQAAIFATGQIQTGILTDT